MLCENCRSSNAENAKYCAVCGAPLPDGYNDGYNGIARSRPPRGVQNADISRYFPRNQYAQGGVSRVQEKPRRSAGAIVFYMLSGLLALACLAMPLLPNIRLFGMNGGRTFSAPEYALNLLDKNSLFSENAAGSQLTGAVILGMFLLPMIFQLLWAIFSFVRIGAAGGVGLTGSIISTNIGVYWIVYLYDRAPIGGSYFISGSGGTGDWLTMAPYLIAALGVVGIVFSSVQLSQRNRVR